jgi:1-deoxyxylulose-5-phosphate synthase
MEFRHLGRSGLKISEITYGNWITHGGQVEADAATACVRAALDAGITTFDTANVYSTGRSEEITGKILGELADRDDIVVATKVHGEMRPGPYGHGQSRKAILAEIDNSLRRLKMEYVDLYQIHRWDEGTPIEETMEALHDVVKAGKARYIGASSMFAWQFAKAQAAADRRGGTRFISMQNHYNLVYREEEREMIPQCIDQGVGVLPWSPLARGLLAGNRTREGERLTARAGTDPFGESLYDPDVDFSVVDRVNEIAAKRGVPGAQVALAWLIHRPGVTAPIVGATKAAHVDDAVAAEALELTTDEVTCLEEVYVPHAVSGHQ